MRQHNDLRTCRKVPLRAAQVVPGHPLLGRDSQFGWFSGLWLALICAPVAIVAISPLFYLDIVDIPDNGAPKLGFFYGWAIMVVVSIVVWGSIANLLTQAMHRKRVRANIEEKYGPIDPSDEYVGVSFAPTAWAVNSNTSWDFGVINLDRDRLRFQGIKTEFELPLFLVEKIDLRQHRGAVRVYLDWLDEDGAAQVVCLDPMTGRKHGEYVLALRDGLQLLLGSAKAVATNPNKLPPRSSQMPLVEVVPTPGD